MIFKALAFFLGIAFCLRLHTPLSHEIVWFLLIISCSLFWVQQLRFPVICIFGMLWANFFIHHLESYLLAQSLEGKIFLIQARVSSLVKHEGVAESFYVDAEGPVFGKIKLAAYHQALFIQAGQTWQFLVKLKRPWGFANPGGFLYQNYLWMQQVVANGYVLDSPKNKILKQASPGILSLRARLAKQISQQGGDYARFIQALSIGDRDQFTQQDWTVLQRTGTNHLVAISGLHIGLLSGLVFLGLGFLWRRSRILCLIVPAQIMAAYGAIAIAILYSALAGFALPTQRAVIMLSIFMIAVIARRSTIPWYSFGLALILVLLFNPLAVLDSGFYLSFFAVAFLIFTARSSQKIFYHRFVHHFFYHWIKPQFIVILGIAPWTLFYFQQFSVVSPLANILTIPIVGFILVPLCLLTCLCFSVHAQLLAILVLHLAEKVMAVVWWILTGLAQHSFSSIFIRYFPVWKLALAIVILGLLVGSLSRFYKILALFGVPLLCLKMPSLPEGVFQFTLLDVGQGLAAVIQTAHHALVFDTGPKFSEDFNAGTAVVLPFLQAKGISKIDKLVLSHGDSDHIGGAQAILNTLPVLSISSSVPQRFHGATLCVTGQNWQWDGVNFEFLYPDAAHLDLDNNSSCVLKISNAFHSVLLTGDIEALAEHYLVMHEKEQLKSSILIVPHHGSKTSSTEIFLKAVQPAYAFFPVGYLNRFHFPSSSVIARYQAFQAKLLSTAVCGAIEVRIDNKNSALSPVCYRQTLPFYLQ